MPTDGALLRPLELLVQAFRLQHENYLKLEEATRALGAYLEAGEPLEDARVAELNEAQDASFHEVRKADERIKGLKRRLGEIVGDSEINLAKLKRALPNGSERSPYGRLIHRLEELATQLADDVKRIQRQAELNEKSLKRRLGDLTGDLRQVRQGRSAAQAYRQLAKGVVRPASFLDEKK